MSQLSRQECIIFLCVLAALREFCLSYHFVRPFLGLLTRNDVQVTNLTSDNIS